MCPNHGVGSDTHLDHVALDRLGRLGLPTLSVGGVLSRDLAWEPRGLSQAYFFADCQRLSDLVRPPGEVNQYSDYQTSAGIRASQFPLAVVGQSFLKRVCSQDEGYLFQPRAL